MTPESNKDIVRKWIDAWVNRDVAMLDQIFAPDYAVNGTLVGVGGVKQSVEYLHTVLADISAEARELVAEGDKVAMRWTVRGRHVGDFMGVPPTGQMIELQGINIYRLFEGKIVENHELTNVSETIQKLKAGR